MNATRFVLTATLLSSLSLAAAAQSLVVKCETRASRAKASVDGNNLAGGQYSAVIVSGAHRAQSPMDSTVGDEVGFDFASNAKDIAAGATAIASNFIVGGKLTGQLLDASGAVVIQRAATCRVR